VSESAHDEIRGDVRTLSADAASSWRELRTMAAHAPRPVRQYRFWCTLQAAGVAVGGLIVVTFAQIARVPYPWLWGWAAAVILGNAAFMLMLAFPPRRRRAYRVAWWFAVAWLVISGLACLPLLIFAVPAFACISHVKCVGWYQDRERPEEGPPRRPHHPWGFPRVQPESPGAPPPPRAA